MSYTDEELGFMFAVGTITHEIKDEPMIARIKLSYDILKQLKPLPSHERLQELLEKSSTMVQYAHLLLDKIER